MKLYMVDWHFQIPQRIGSTQRDLHLRVMQRTIQVFVSGDIFLLNSYEFILELHLSACIFLYILDIWVPGKVFRCEKGK